MRYALLCVGLIASIGLYNGWFTAAYDHATTAALSDDARLAIDVRCQGDDPRANDECRTMFIKLFLSGSLDPDRTLRTYCDSVKQGRWGGSRPPSPPLCVERYGGWQES